MTTVGLLNNLDVMNKFLEKYKGPNFIQEKIDDINSPVSIK